jgi:hypothetical protein
MSSRSDACHPIATVHLLPQGGICTLTAKELLEEIEVITDDAEVGLTQR